MLTGAFIRPVLTVDFRRALNHYIGYERGRHRRRSHTGRTVREVAGEHFRLPAEQLDEILDPIRLARGLAEPAANARVAESTVGRFRFLLPRLHDFIRNDRYSRRMTEYAEDIARWFQVNAGKLIWLTIVLAILLADRVISRVLRKILDNSQIPSASIFVNLTRVTIWVTGAAMVLQPVFSINPTTLITALGVGGVASLV